MSLWRVIMTDSESPTGIAPVCETKHQDDDRIGVYDCCPGPHIECWSEGIASTMAVALTVAEAKLI